MIGVLKDRKGRIVRDRYEVSKRSLDAGHDIIIFGQISDEDDQKHPERTVTFEEFSFIYKKLIDFFAANPEKLHNLRTSVKRILYAKHKIYGFENFSNAEHMKLAFNKKEFINLVHKNSDIAKEIADNSIILISEEGNIIESIKDSKYFSNGKGPLSHGKLIENGDKICIVSPVFSPPDELYREISSRWIPPSEIKSVHMVYGWLNPRRIKQAEKIWCEKITRFSYFNDYGEIRFINKAINEKIEQIVKATENAKVLIIGIITQDHIEILNRICNKFKNNNEIHIIVLLYKEPYFISKSIYNQKNTIVIYSSPKPDLVAAAKLLFGELPPKGVSFMPVSIPNKIHRQISPGEPVIPFNIPDTVQTKKEEEKEIPENGINIFLVIIGGVIGGLVIYLIPRGRLVWNSNSKTQYCIVDFFCCVLLGTATATIIAFLIPYINDVKLGPVNLTNIKFTAPILIIIGIIFGFIGPALWLNFIKKK